MHLERAAHPQQLGPYELLRLLATGGMAEVYEARLPGPHGFSKRVAVKRMLPQFARDARLVAMFCDEARIHAGLDHPNLVEVIDFGEDGGELYLAMELVDGPSCAEVLTSVAARRRSVDLGVVLYIGQQVLRALDYVHHAADDRGIPLRLVHRDVAPANVLIGRAGDVKLGDFGIIRGAGIEARTEPGELKGKIGYVSPEQAAGAPLDGRSDLFSLAVTLAELLIGKPLFAGRNELEILQHLYASDLSTLRRHGRHIPSDVVALLERALARRPEDRPASALEFGMELSGCIQRHAAGVGPLALVEWLRDVGIGEIKSGIRVESHPPHAELPHVAAAMPATPSTPPANDTVTAPAVSYRMRRPGGTIVGPLRLARLLEMLATGRVGLDTQLSRNGGPFVALSGMGELAHFAARPAYRFFDAVAVRAKERWRFDRVMLPAVLFHLVLEGRTGLLVAVEGREQKRLFLVNGSPQFAVSTDPGELLGAALVQSGLLAEDLMERALEDGHRSGRRLGEVLVAEGILRPSSLLAALAEQRQRRVVALCRMRAGEIYFVDGATSGEDLATPPRGPVALLARALLVAYSTDEIARLLAPLRDAPLERSHDARRIAQLLDLRPEAARALDLAQGGISAAALVQGPAQSGNIGRANMLGALFLGLYSGAIKTRAS